LACELFGALAVSVSTNSVAVAASITPVPVGAGFNERLVSVRRVRTPARIGSMAKQLASVTLGSGGGRHSPLGKPAQPVSLVPPAGIHAASHNGFSCGAERHTHIVTQVLRNRKIRQQLQRLRSS
jgi:hypothetical protein